MKKFNHTLTFKLLNVLTIFLILYFTISCNKSSTELFVEELDPTNVSHAEILEIIALTEEKGIPFPDGSKAYDDGAGGVIIELPEGFKYIVKDENLVTTSSSDIEAVGIILAVGVTCSCNKGSGGCSPVKAQGSYYCVMGNSCATCSKSTSSAGQVVTILGVYDSNSSVSLLSNSNVKKIDGLDAVLFSDYTSVRGNVFPELLDIDEVKKSLMDVYELVYGDSVPRFITENSHTIPQGYKFVKINIYGYEGAIAVPEKYVDKSMRAMADYEVVGNIAAAVSCKCNRGKGCTLGSKFGVKYCDASNCTSCTLND